MQTLEEFHTDLLQDVVSRAKVEQIYKEEALFELISTELVDLGEFEEAYYTHFKPMRGGIQVDGYCGDPLEDTVAKEANAGILRLILMEYSGTNEIKTITQSTLTSLKKRGLKFISKSLDPSFRRGLEETDPGRDVADLVARRWDTIDRIKVYIFTDRVLSAQAKGLETESVVGREVSFDLWDTSRLYRLASSGQERERLVVDFSELPGGPLKALKAGSVQGVGDVFLAVVSGIDLAMIYNQWGARLLEQNVRVFLQARSSVNKGIKSTLENSPDLFFSYNNGITATAEHIEYDNTGEGTRILKLDNLQIVNGGQTTASICAAWRRKVDLSKVFVQMKLNIVLPEKATDLVPQISQYANSQNKVAAADFFSNHQFHIRIEDFSRRLWAPPVEGSFDQTKWFYERARGQYQDMLSQLSTAAEKHKFKLEYPKSQEFTKTDLAKYIMVWSDKPYFVNRGAQKNFAEFAQFIAKEWERDNEQFNEYYYHCLVAKKIAYNACERIVSGRPWYEAGMYRANHVVLATGLIAHSVSLMRKVVDFEAVWNRQAISPAFEVAFGIAADAVHDVIMNPKQGSHNIQEWTKQPNCWEEAKRLHPSWNAEWLTELLDLSAERELRAEAKKDQSVLNSINAQAQVVGMGGEFWTDVLRWAQANNAISDKEAKYLRSATRISQGKIPQDWQCEEIVKLMGKLGRAGCPYKMGTQSAARRRRGARAR